MAVHKGESTELYPVAIGIIDDDDKYHLIEASRTLSRQLYLWAKSTEHLKGKGGINMIPSITSVTLTHLHLGHVDGLGLFGREAIGSPSGSIRLISSAPVINSLKCLDPFCVETITNESTIQLGSGVALEFWRVPHREEEGSETYGIVIRGTKKSIFFLPDHDTYKETLEFHKMSTIKDWLRSLNIDLALIDGTFFTVDEVCCRRADAKGIPHPTISESLEKLGQKNDGDPDVIFVHLNHTNPAIDDESKKKEIEKLGWSIGQQGQTWLI